MKIFQIEFLNPEYFLILLIFPIFVYFFYKIRSKRAIFSPFDDLNSVFKSSSFLYFFKIFLIFLILFFLSIILANPNKVNILEKDKKNWIDIVFALDISESMNAYDLNPTRLELAKKLISDFIKKQNTNRVWLVVFAWKPFIWIPLTFDYNILAETIKNISSSTINQKNLSWTAIWDAILMSKNIFDENDKKREKIIILLTDWDANTWIDPKIAAKFTSEKNIKIFSIWIWWEKEAFVDYKVWPFTEKVSIPPLNDESLQEISKISFWKFFRATDNKTFENIFKDLEKLEKTDIEILSKKTYKDFYDFFAYILSFLIFLLIISFIYKKN